MLPYQINSEHWRISSRNTSNSLNLFNREPGQYLIESGDVSAVNKLITEIINHSKLSPSLDSDFGFSLLYVSNYSVTQVMYCNDGIWSDVWYQQPLLFF